MGGRVAKKVGHDESFCPLMYSISKKTEYTLYFNSSASRSNKKRKQLINYN